MHIPGTVRQLHDFEIEDIDLSLFALPVLGIITMKTKSVKLPIELIEYLEKRNDNRPPGEVLLGIVKDYEQLEEYAKCIAEQKKIDLKNTAISDVFKLYISEESTKIEGFKKSIDELKTIVSGLRLFFEKSKEWKEK